MPDTGNTFLANTLHFPVYIMAKPVGALCNLDCSYCYYIEKSKLYPQGKAEKMSVGLLERFVSEYIACQPTPDVLFTWHGGEPLLRGLDFYKHALAFQRKYAGGRHVDNSVQTNGLLLNDEWCRFLKENNFLVGISLDGPEHVHNKYRLDRGGKGSFSRVMRAVELLQKYDIPFNTLSVINDYSVRFPEEIYAFFKQINSRYMQFSPVVERWGDRPDGLELLSAFDNGRMGEMTEWSVSSRAYGDFYCRIFDEWIKSDVGRYFVQLFDAVLANMVGEFPGVCIYARTCGHAGAIEANGDVYACDHFVFPEYKLGNIRTDGLVFMMLSDRQMSFGKDKFDTLPRQCRRCKYLNLCNGECPKNRIAISDDGEEGLNYLCEGLFRFFEHVQPYMEFMAAELCAERAPANVMSHLDEIRQNIHS